MFTPAKYLHVLTSDSSIYTNMLTRMSTTDQTHCRESLHLPNNYRCSLSMLSLSQICSHIHLRHFRLIAETLFTCYTSTYSHLRFFYPYKHIYTYICNSTNSSPRACLSAKHVHMLKLIFWPTRKYSHICLQLIKFIAEILFTCYGKMCGYMRGYVSIHICVDI